MTDRWRDKLADLDISNVFIYVGDAVRWDYTPPTLLDQGISCKSIAASIHSPTSFATLATGVHPPNHGVYEFTHQLNEEVNSIFDIPDVDTRFVNSVRDQPSGEDPIFSVLNVEDTEEPTPFESISEPFVVMERGPGGHAPYGDFEGTAWEYFEQLQGKSISTIKTEYEQSVVDDKALFDRRVQELSDRGLLADTLIVYTSDHGELLGENGLLGHNGPMLPALIEVPTVFIHPSLPDESLTEGVFRHIDLLPTVLDMVGVNNASLDGKSICKSWPLGPGLSFYRVGYPTYNVPGLSGYLEYEGVWDWDGGHIFTNTSFSERLAIFCGKVIRSPKRHFLRRNIFDSMWSYMAGDKTYGKPTIGLSESRELLELVRMEAVESARLDLSKRAEEHLHDLGYL